MGTDRFAGWRRVGEWVSAVVLVPFSRTPVPDDEDGWSAADFPESHAEGKRVRTHTQASVVLYRRCGGVNGE